MLTLSPAVLEQVADEVERDPTEELLLRAARRAATTPAQQAGAALLEARAAEGRLTVEANSVERLRDLQQRVLAAAPGAELVSESIVPVEQLLAERRRDSETGRDQDRQAAQPPFSAKGLPPEESAVLLDQFMREYEQRWPDQKLPALSGRTPRQAVAEGGSPLAQLHSLLDDMQWRADTSGGGMSAARIRRDLGLTHD